MLLKKQQMEDAGVDGAGRAAIKEEDDESNRFREDMEVESLNEESHQG